MGVHSCDGKPPALLTLPPNVRHSIYLDLGLANWDGSPKVFDFHEGTRLSYAPKFHGLLLSCRTIHAEAAAVLYSANIFIIHYRKHASLRPLFALSPTSIASLTRLKVVLNETSCHDETGDGGPGMCCCDYMRGSRLSDCEKYRWHSHGTPLQSSNSLAEAIFMEWHSAAAYLSTHLSPGKLELSLVCDLHRNYSDAAKFVVEPILMLPALRDCLVRLCKVPDKKLQRIARDVVQRACRLPQPLKATASMQAPESDSNPLNCQLLRLAREVRLQILQYTDLITPCNEVTWSRQHKGYRICRSGCVDLDATGMKCPPHVHHGCQFQRCWIQYPGPSLGCFCRLQHSAFSSTCKCWAPPVPLFLICRLLHEDAQFVFFSGNRFVVHDFKSHPPYEAPLGHYPHQDFAAKVFLKETIPTNCVSHLRFLEIVFPPYNYKGWPGDTHTAQLDWIETIQWLKERTHDRCLTLRLVMADASDWGPPRDRVNMELEQGRRVLEGYMRIIRPLSHLGNVGLRRFYTKLAWPWRWTSQTFERVLETKGWEWVDSKERELKDHAERLITGTDNAQEKEPPDSVWQHAYARDA